MALDDAAAKANLVSEVVAFLNAGPGCLVIGVAEKRGTFAGFRPLAGDPDATCLRIQQTVQDNIAPKPARVAALAINVEGGFLIVVEVPEHLQRPCQNTLTGAFHIRAGARNTPLTRDMVQAMFTSHEKQESDLLAHLRSVDGELARQDDVPRGASLHIGVLPHEHYRRDRPPFRRTKQGWVTTVPAFHDGRALTFEGCNGGQQAVQRSWDDKVHCRVFVSNDWFLHAWVAYPFRMDEREGGLHSLEGHLQRFMAGLAGFAAEEGLAGPFLVALAVRGLRASDKTAWLFPFTDDVVMPRSRATDRIDEPAMLAGFCGMVISSSRHG